MRPIFPDGKFKSFNFLEVLKNNIINNIRQIKSTPLTTERAIIATLLSLSLSVLSFSADHVLLFLIKRFNPQERYGII